MDLPGPGDPRGSGRAVACWSSSVSNGSPTIKSTTGWIPIIPAELDRAEDILRRNDPARGDPGPVAAGLGSEMELGIGAVPVDERERLVADELRAHFARERAEIDLVPEGSEEVLNFVPPWMYPVRSVGKRIGGYEPGLPVPVRVPGNLIDGAVPHAVAEDLRGLAVAAGERAAPGDLDIALHPGKCRIGVEVHAGVGRFRMIPGDDPRNFPVPRHFRDLLRRRGSVYSPSPTMTYRHIPLLPRGRPWHAARQQW